MPAEIRMARASDVDDLAAIENAVFQGDRISRRSFRKLIERDTAETFVAAGGGPSVQWSIEMGWPEAMFKQGFRRNDPKPGDKVNVSIHPLRDGRPGGAFISVKLADGRVIGEGQGA